MNLAGLSAVSPGFIQGLNDQRGIMEDRQKQAVLEALGRAYPQLFQSLPGVQPTVGAPPQVGGPPGAMSPQAFNERFNPVGQQQPPSPGMDARFADAFAGSQSAPAGGRAPRGIRNNNPGNIRDGSFAQSQPGYRSADAAGFAQFDQPQAGQQAITNLLQSYARKGLTTVSQIINRWAPPNADGNNTPAYIAFVSQKAGVDPNTPLTPEQYPLVMAAMMEHENGQAVPVAGGQGASAGGAQVPGNGAAPQQLNLPSTEGIKPGSLSWAQVVQAIQQRNPGIEPAVLAQAVNGFMPFMEQQQQDQWHQISEQRLNKLADATAAKTTAPKPLLRAAINDLSGVGETFTNMSRLASGWKDSYGGKLGGWGGGMGGEALNFAARMTGLGDTEAANWWQDYQNQKNVARHTLFGSALTATEKAAWEAATINPGMQPAIIKQNLERQYQASQRAASKLANAYVAQGKSKEEIEAALGIPLDQLGVEIQPGAGSAGTLPEGVTEEDLDFTAKQHGLTREQVLEQLGAQDAP